MAGRFEKYRIIASPQIILQEAREKREVIFDVEVKYIEDYISIYLAQFFSKP